MLAGDVSERIPATRLVIEPDASCLSTMGMVPLEAPFIFNTARNPAFELREGKGRLTLAECVLEARQKDVLDGMLDRIDPQRSLRLYVVCRVPGEIKAHGWMTVVMGKTPPSEEGRCRSGVLLASTQFL